MPAFSHQHFVTCIVYTTMLIIILQATNARVRRPGGGGGGGGGGGNKATYFKGFCMLTLHAVHVQASYRFRIDSIQ